MFMQCSPRLHVCRSVTHSLMSAGRVRPSEAAGRSRYGARAAGQPALPSRYSLPREQHGLCNHPFNKDLWNTYHGPRGTW